MQANASRNHRQPLSEPRRRRRTPRGEVWAKVRTVDGTRGELLKLDDQLAPMPATAKQCSRWPSAATAARLRDDAPRWRAAAAARPVAVERSAGRR